MKELLHQIVDQALHWIESLGYWGILIGLMIEVIPSEIVLAYGGYLVSLGKISFWGAVVYGTIGGTVAQLFVYWIGRYGGRPFLEKYGKYILIKKHHIDVAERWFNQYGAGVIFSARFIPVVRHAISAPAGIAKMPLARFTLLTALAVLPWSILFIYLGMTLGDNWEQIDEKASPYVGPFMAAAIALLAAYFGWKYIRIRRGRSETKHGDEGERATAHQLRYIGREYRVLNGRRVRAGGGVQEFDHIVVGPNGVFHIDSKHWAGDIRFTEHGVERDTGRKAEDPTAQMYRHEYVLKELLREHGLQADVVGVICFTHPDARISGRSPAFATVRLDRLAHAIKTHAAKRPLSAEQVERIARLIDERSEPSRRTS